MKEIKLHKGLSLVHKKDGIWMNFKTTTGLYASINIDNTFKGGGIINKAIRIWSKEQF